MHSPTSVRFLKSTSSDSVVVVSPLSDAIPRDKATRTVVHPCPTSELETPGKPMGSTDESLPAVWLDADEQGGPDLPNNGLRNYIWSARTVDPCDGVPIWSVSCALPSHAGPSSRVVARSFTGPRRDPATSPDRSRSACWSAPSINVQQPGSQT